MAAISTLEIIYEFPLSQIPKRNFKILDGNDMVELLRCIAFLMRFYGAESHKKTFCDSKRKVASVISFILPDCEAVNVCLI